MNTFKQWVTAVRGELISLSRQVVALLILTSMPVMMSVAHASTLAPLGMAEYKRLNRSEFIAELSVPEEWVAQGAELAQRLIETNMPAQMKMTVTAQRLSARNFVNRWLEGMAVNNKANTLALEKETIQAFASAFKGRLLKGDRVIISRKSNDLNVLVNGVSILSIPSKQGFSLLLSTWIGDVPLSSNFRRGILGQDSYGELMLRAEHLSVLPHRERAIRSWVEVTSSLQAHGENSNSGIGPSENEIPLAPVSQESADLPTEPSEPQEGSDNGIDTASGENMRAAARTVKPKAQQLKIPELIDQLSASRPSSKLGADRKGGIDAPPSRSMTKKPTSLSGEISDVRASRPKSLPPKSDTSVVAAKSAPNSSAKEQLAANSPQSTLSTPASGNLGESDLSFAPERLLEYQQYYSRMSKSVNVHRNLPRSALVRRISGEVRVAVKLDRTGRVLSQSLVSPSRHKVLNKQAMEAVTLASPFDPVPESITGDNLVFDVLVVYPKYW